METIRTGGDNFVAVVELWLAFVAVVVWSLVTLVSAPLIRRFSKPIDRQRSIALLAVIDASALTLLVRSIDDVYGLPDTFVQVVGAITRGLLMIVGIAILLTWHRAEKS